MVLYYSATFSSSFASALSALSLRDVNYFPMQDHPFISFVPLNFSNHTHAIPFLFASLPLLAGGNHYVLAVEPHGPAAGVLRPNDQIVMVNRVTTDHLSHHTVVRLLSRQPLAVDLVVSRDPLRRFPPPQQRTDNVGTSSSSVVDDLKRRHAMQRSYPSSVSSSYMDTGAFSPPGGASNLYPATQSPTMPISLDTGVDHITPVRRQPHVRNEEPPSSRRSQMSSPAVHPTVSLMVSIASCPHFAP